MGDRLLRRHRGEARRQWWIVADGAEISKWAPRTRTTRLLAIIGNALWIALLLWWVAAGPIFVQPYADLVAKGCLLLAAGLCVLDLVLTARNLRTSIPEPAL